MKKHLLVIILALFQIITYAGDKSFGERVREKCMRDEYNAYIDGQVTLGYMVPILAGTSYGAYKLYKKSMLSLPDKEKAYKDEKAVRSEQYKQNPTWKQFIKNQSLKLKNTTPIVARKTFGVSMAAGAIIAGLYAIVTPGYIYTNYAKHNYDYSDSKKRA